MRRHREARHPALVQLVRDFVDKVAGRAPGVSIGVPSNVKSISRLPRAPAPRSRCTKIRLRARLQ